MMYSVPLYFKKSQRNKNEFRKFPIRTQPQKIQCRKKWISFFGFQGFNSMHGAEFTLIIYLTQLKSNLSVYHRAQRIKLCTNTNFQSSNAKSVQIIKGNPIEDWSQVPLPKNSFWGYFRIGVHLSSYAAYQTIQEYFHSFNANSAQVIEGNPIEDWGQIPQSENSFWGHFLIEVHLSSCLAYQTV